MYEERRESFSVRDLVLQILFVVLFIFILIWLFPTKDYMRRQLEGLELNQTSDHDIDRLAVLHNQLFASNVKQMRDAAIKYYTLERLPSKTGESDKMTLQRMYDLSLVLPLIDIDGNPCDPVRSFVEVTRHETEWILKVNLSCGGEENYILVHLGCRDYCLDRDVCVKAKPPAKPPVQNWQCEYRRVSGGTVGDWGPWSEWSRTPVTEGPNRQVQTRQERYVTGYRNEQVQVGTRPERVQIGTRTERVQVATTTQRVQVGTTTQRVQVGTTTERVQTGTTRVVVGHTTREVPVRVAAGTTRVYAGSGSGPTVPASTSTRIFVRTGSTTTQACSTCEFVTIHTWDIFNIQTVYRTEIRIEQVPIYGTQPVFETRTVPVFETRTVPVYETRTVPVYETRQVPVYETRQVPIYETRRVPVYGYRTLYRFRTRRITGGDNEEIRWSTCKPVDANLISRGFHLTGNRRPAK